MKYQKGFSFVELLLVLVVVGIVGSVGYLAYTNFWAPKDSAETSQTDQESSDEPVVVEDEKDLDSALSQLDDTAIEDSEDDTLDNAASDF